MAESDGERQTLDSVCAFVKYSSAYFLASDALLCSHLANIWNETVVLEYHSAFSNIRRNVGRNAEFTFLGLYQLFTYQGLVP